MGRLTLRVLLFGITGLIFAEGILACVYYIYFDREGYERQLAGLVLQVVAAVSAPLFVQARYLMAALLLASAPYGISHYNGSAIFADDQGIFFPVLMTLVFLDVTPPPVTGENGGGPSFLQLHWNVSQ